MRRPLTVLLLGLLLVLLPGTLASAGGGGGSVCAGFGEGTTVVLRDNCFEGTGHLAPPGATSLTARNEGQLPHTITAVDGSFDSGVLEPGERFELTLDGHGPVPVYCTLHGTRDGYGMAGVLFTAPAPAAATDDAELATSTGSGSPTAAWIVALVVAAGAAGVALGRRKVRAATTSGEAG